MKHHLYGLSVALSAMCCLAPFAERSAAQDGIYADFTTSMGSFTCRLEYVLAPKTVANFIGLATGQRPWLDMPTGRARTNAFYNGLTFHRVIKDFMNQSGSPNGLGTDDPGYAFQDEINASLKHDGVGVLSMANSGKNSNGSQFFITATNTSWLDGKHTVFGKVISGTNVIMAINRVATDGTSKPLTNVVIQNIGIRRVGTAAQAFNIHAQGLPGVTNLVERIARSGTNVVVTFTNRLYADNRLFTSTNLTTWAQTGLDIEITPPTNNSVTWPAVGGKGFFRMAQVSYPSSTFAPKSVRGKTLALVFTWGTTTINFTNVTTGSYTSTFVAPGKVIYTYYQEPYRGLLWPIYFDYDDPMTLTLEFASATAGTFSGSAYYLGSFPYDVAGTFTLSGP